MMALHRIDMGKLNINSFNTSEMAGLFNCKDFIISVAFGYE